MRVIAGFSFPCLIFFCRKSHQNGEEAAAENMAQATENTCLDNFPNEKRTILFESDDNCECLDTNDFERNTRESSELLAAEALLELRSKTQYFSEKKEDIHKLVNKDNFTLFDLLRTDDDLKVFTGINFNLLQNLSEAFSLSQKKQIYYHVVSVEERIVLCLCKLKLNLTFKCLSVLFRLNRKICTQHFINTLHTLAFILKNAIYWPTKEEILCSMPICFNEFQETFAVLDCTEIAIEKPKCLNCRLRLYSHYKGCETMKFLVAVAPSGLIIYVSEPFGGRASDKAILNHSKILRKLEANRDAVMVDKGIAIEEECAAARIKLIIPPRLGKNKQLGKADVTMTKHVASARVHVERTIQRIKLFEIMKSKITQKIAPYMDEICKVVCGIVNLSESIIDDDGFPNTQSAPMVKKKKKLFNCQ